MPRSHQRGFSLVDVVVGISLMVVLFLSLFGILKVSLILSTIERAKAGATAVAQTQMEYLRGLSYASLGTVGGIPIGSVPQFATTTQNGITYVTHTFINYIDDTADGTGASDTNGIITDYKRAAVTVSYTISNQFKSIGLVSNFAPLGVETTAGGGTLIVKVVNAVGAPIMEASVSIINTSLSPAVNIATFSNIDGVVSLPGAAVSSNYKVAVSKSGYSSAQTYARDSTNQNPSPGYLTVSRNQTTTGTFPIDLMASFTLSTFSPIATSTFADTFADSSKLSNMSSTTISGGVLKLIAGESHGSALSITTTPSRLVSWGELLATVTIPQGASIIIHLYDGNGNLLPDTSLPGNAAGFSTFPLSLAAIATSTYPSLAIGASLSTTTGSPPTISDWSLSYAAGPTPLPNISFTLTGAKTIGSTGGGSPIYKTVINGSTGASAATTLASEWDQYTPTISGRDIIDSCSAPPFVVAPGSTSSASLILGAATANSLRVLVSDNTGAPVSGASVLVSRTGYSNTVLSSSCGQAYFGAITSATNYSVRISKTGYTTKTFTNVRVTGVSTYGASFP